MKKLYVLILGIIILSMTGCGKSKAEPEKKTVYDYIERKNACYDENEYVMRKFTLVDRRPGRKNLCILGKMVYETDEENFSVTIKVETEEGLQTIVVTLGESMKCRIEDMPGAPEQYDIFIPPFSPEDDLPIEEQVYYVI